MDIKSETEIIGCNLKEIRQRYGYSQKEIGKVIKVSFQQVQKYENGVNRLPIDKLFHLRNLYDIPYSCFFEGIEQAVRSDHIPAINEISARVLNLKNKGQKKKICKIVSILLD